MIILPYFQLQAAYPLKSRRHHSLHRLRDFFIAAVIASSCAISVSGSFAQTGPEPQTAVAGSGAVAQNLPLQAGDAVVTNFSGVRDSGAGTPESPEAGFSIETNGNSAVVLRLTGAQPGPAPNVIKPQVMRTATAAEVGQVFAIALDGPEQPNVYLGATSAFGLQIVKRDADATEGGTRLRTGDPAAQWMDGQFGAQGGPGSIWKMDNATGAISLFANIEMNTGPGIGGLAFHTASRHLYASDLDTGLIHRFDANGKQIDTFDHGVDGRQAANQTPVTDDDSKVTDITNVAFNVEDPTTWGFTAPERQITALAVFQDRLYYAVAVGPSIWSVGIGRDGALGKDVRNEVEIQTQHSSPITSLAFDSDGILYAAQRGQLAPRFDFTSFAQSGQAQVFRFQRNDGSASWRADPLTYASGHSPDYNNATGGVDVGCRPTTQNQKPEACENFVWKTIDGAQQAAAGLVQNVAQGDFVWTTIDGNQQQTSVAVQNLAPAEGEQSQQAAPDPSTQHGLQATERTRLRTGNEAPSEVTFAIYDEITFSEIEAFTGDIKIIKAAIKLDAPEVPRTGPLPKLPVEQVVMPRTGYRPAFLAPPLAPVFSPDCPRGMILIEREDGVPVCRWPVCPPGTFGRPPYCRLIKPCPPGMTGKPPFCRPVIRECPPGTYGRPPFCRLIRPCPPGMIGRPPFCRPVFRDCPPGMVGRPPFCRRLNASCPPGMIGRPPICRQIIRDCPPGMVGRPPFCRQINRDCPPGMIGRPPFCRSVLRPAGRACPGGMVGFPPNCRPLRIRPNRDLERRRREFEKRRGEFEKRRRGEFEKRRSRVMERLRQREIEKRSTRRETLQDRRRRDREAIQDKRRQRETEKRSRMRENIQDRRRRSRETLQDRRQLQRERFQRSRDQQRRIPRNIERRFGPSRRTPERSFQQRGFQQRMIRQRSFQQRSFQQRSFQRPSFQRPGGFSSRPR